jgi:hypothetical protein
MLRWCRARVESVSPAGMAERGKRVPSSQVIRSYELRIPLWTIRAYG